VRYALGAATLSINWTEYFNVLFPDLISRVAAFAVNAIIVVIKVAIGWKFINPTNLTPFTLPMDATYSG
jgi:hypothetical protein